MEFKLFEEKYSITNTHSEIEEHQKTVNSELNDLFKKYGGVTINNGLFRIHNFNSSQKWTKIVTDTFENYRDKIIVFGFDWMGRQFAKDLNRNYTYFFDVATGEDFELNNSLSDFFEIELIEYAEETLMIEEFRNWKKNNSKLEFHEIVGFKIPLWLGGSDSIENFEKIDNEVNWEINRQLMTK